MKNDSAKTIDAKKGTKSKTPKKTSLTRKRRAKSLNVLTSDGISVCEENGIYVAFPENWSIEMDPMSSCVHISNGDGAFWFLQKHEIGADPENLAQGAVDTLKAEYQDMEIERFEKVMFDKFVTGYEMTFYYLDLMNFATIQCYESNGAMYVIFWQTGNQLIIMDEEEIPVEKILEAITFSALKGKASSDTIRNSKTTTP
ncbi:MAG: hypothetical protein ACRCUY_13815 [Thermoguttaceae bacterium]